ncbi:MAG: hypothetical protein ORN85_08570, partial [Sediminibacterium sp.]|nr:hypothetical protein [Sediminibacterium sp.]
VTFDNLIKLFNNENAIFFKTKKFYICLDDCPRVTIKVNGYKIISSISPNYDSHPEIFNFITSTLTFFRSKKLLSDDKNITNGY